MKRMWLSRLIWRVAGFWSGLSWTKRAVKELCQLEGSDCGGRDRRPSWHWRALSILNWMASFYDSLTFWHQRHPQRWELYTPKRISQRLFCDESDKSLYTNGDKCWFFSELTVILASFYTWRSFPAIWPGSSVGRARP